VAIRGPLVFPCQNRLNIGDCRSFIWITVLCIMIDRRYPLRLIPNVDAEAGIVDAANFHYR
jgi:hypothetical protein